MSLANKVGYFSSIGLVVVGVAYVGVVAFGMFQAGFDDPIVDPTLATMEVLTFRTYQRRSLRSSDGWTPNQLYRFGMALDAVCR
jgi:hypothetical protein